MSENENEFEALRRLLALKRHEVPPPGYFEHFPGAVMARLRAGQSGARDGVAERLEERLPWLFRILRALEEKPAFATTFASALCLLLLAGIVYAERPELAAQPLMSSAQEVSPLGLTLASAAKASPPVEPVDLRADFIYETDPVLDLQPMGGSPAVALFGSQDAVVQPAALTFPGN